MGGHKKVLMFLQNGVGGAERMTVLIGKFLVEHGSEVRFYTIGDSGRNTPISDFIPDDIFVENIKYTSTISLIKNIRTVVKKESPDVVFSSVLFISNKLLLLRPFFPKIKFIVRCENYFYTFNPRQQFLIKTLYPFADAIIAQTKEMRDELINEAHINADKVHTLENPIDKSYIDNKISLSSSPYDCSDKIRFAASGRFAYQKGFDLLVEAFNIVHQSVPDAELYIIGHKDGVCKSEYEKVEKIIQRYELENYIHCVGFQTNPYSYIKYADCFVLSSRWEGLPNVLIEALYLGTPAAAFACIPIIERIVNDGINGYVVKAEDVNGLASAMLDAAKLGRVDFTYKGAGADDYVNLFQ